MKVLYSFFMLLLLPTAFLYGESEIRMRSIENRVNRLEKENNRPLESVTPCAGPRVCDGMDIHLSASFLYWTARLDTLSYAKTGFGDLTTSFSPNKGHIESVDWSWNPGFKTTLGWNFCHGCWDMLLQYTWFYTNVDGSKTSSSLQPGFQIFTPSFQSTNIVSIGNARAHFDLHYQVGDLELGRNFYVSKSLKLRPFVGAKGTWQKQDYNVFYDSIPIQIALQNILFNYVARFEQALYGVGMRGGMGTSWQFSKNFSLYGNLALTGMWLHYNTERKDTFSVVDENVAFTSEVSTVDIDDRLHLIKPVIEFGIGLRAETYYGCGRYHVLLEAGWETQLWINQTLYASIDNNYDRFDLSLQGLTAKLRLDF